MSKKNDFYANPELAYVFDDIANESKIKEELSKKYKLDNIKTPKGGEVTTATYLGEAAGQFVFDIGFKDFIRIEARLGEAKYLKNTRVGEKIDVLVLGIDESPYLIRGSIAALYESKAHQQLKSLEENFITEAFVREMNPAGYALEINHEGITLPAFMPNTLAGINRLHRPEEIVGKTLKVMIESFSDDEGTYIVSRRKYLQSLIAESIKDLNAEEVYAGHVTGTTDFGVFVEFNECLTGMIHKTNMNRDFQESLSTIKPGTTIEFYVKEIIPDKNGRNDKIILTQTLKKSLWDTIKINQVLDGVVRDTKQFGTLIQLDEETVGLIHTSELEKIKKSFSKGEKAKVKVLAVDRSSRKIFLTVA
jgi:ribosomal protein S1